MHDSTSHRRPPPCLLHNPVVRPRAYLAHLRHSGGGGGLILCLLMKQRNEEIDSSNDIWFGFIPCLYVVPGWMATVYRCLREVISSMRVSCRMAAAVATGHILSRRGTKFYEGEWEDNKPHGQGRCFYSVRGRVATRKDARLRYPVEERCPYHLNHIPSC